jgi:hypothetical protein
MYGVARFFGRRGQHTRARQYCERALESGLPSAIAEQARQELARFMKREIRMTRAASRQVKPRLAAPSSTALDSQMSPAVGKHTRARNAGRV